MPISAHRHLDPVCSADSPPRTPIVEPAFTPALARAVPLLLILHVLFLVWSAFRDAPVTDEPTHLSAGMRHLKYGRFEANRGNPPLVDLIAAVPAALLGARDGWLPEETAGAIEPTFVDANGASGYWYVSLGRCMLIPFSLLGAWTCFRWSGALYGPTAALLSLALWCFDPNVLAAGHLITGDMACTALAVTASFVYWKWLDAPTWGRAVTIGVVLGLCQLAKYVCIVLYIVLPLLWLFKLASLAGRPGSKQLFQDLSQLCAIFTVSLLIINVGYGFERPFQPVDSLAGDNTRRSWIHTSNTSTATPPAAPVGSPPISVPVPLPANYVLGILDIAELFEQPRLSYLSGEWRKGGWWYYYIYALLLKLPLGTLLLIGFATCACVFRHHQSRSFWRLDATVLVPLIAFLGFVTWATTLHMHVRYALPVLPYAFVFAGSALYARSCYLPARYIVAACLLLSCVATFRQCPHFISFFNSLAGGSSAGHHYLIYSNIDWGQDLFYLKKWYDEHPDARPFYLAYFGGSDPCTAGIRYSVARRASASELQTGTLATGWYAISITLARGHAWHVPDGTGGFLFAPPGYYSDLLRRPPVDRVGGSIYIYHVQAATSRVSIGCDRH